MPTWKPASVSNLHISGHPTEVPPVTRMAEAPPLTKPEVQM